MLLNLPMQITWNSCRPIWPRKLLRIHAVFSIVFLNLLLPSALYIASCFCVVLLPPPPILLTRLTLYYNK